MVVCADQYPDDGRPITVQFAVEAPPQNLTDSVSADTKIEPFFPGELLVRDRLAGLKPGAVVTWNMNTPAKATSKGNVLELEAKDANGEERKMTLTASPADAQWRVVPLDEPRTPADSPNPGISRVAFSVVAGESGDVEFTVAFAAILL